MEERRGDYVFVVRMWAEPAGRGVMRGRIDHPASGERRYFSNFGDICDFMTAASAFALRASDEDDRSQSADPDRAHGANPDREPLAE